MYQRVHHLEGRRWDSRKDPGPPSCPGGLMKIRFAEISTNFFNAASTGFFLHCCVCLLVKCCSQGGRKQLNIRGARSALLTVLPLYHRHARVFESSRQEFPCSALPQQGKSSWLLLFFFLLLFPCWGRAEQGNFWRELSNARSWR